MFKCGYIAIVGKPNAGKSSLLNYIIGRKISIVSSKPQTTRNNIIGIKTTPDYQLVFVDTPGIIRTKSGLDKSMMKNVRAAADGCDCIICVIDGEKIINEKTIEFIKTFENKEVPVILAISKIDLLNFDKIYPQIDKVVGLKFLKEIIPFSSKTGQNIDRLIETVLKFTPETEKEKILFSEEYDTDKSVKFMCSEIIREKTLEFLNEEVPHGIAVEIAEFKEDKKNIKIMANIICEKDSHKGIIVGKSGAMIKKIGTKAREDIEKLTEKHVNLELFVKVIKDWRTNTILANRLSGGDEY